VLGSGIEQQHHRRHECKWCNLNRRIQISPQHCWNCQIDKNNSACSQSPKKGLRHGLSMALRIRLQPTCSRSERILNLGLASPFVAIAFSIDSRSLTETTRCASPPHRPNTSSTQTSLGQATRAPWRVVWPPDRACQFS
jgi:hypothetical protein